jgi:hypothetical protein
MRHSYTMKVIFVSALFFTMRLWADEAGDRAAITTIIAALNDPVQRPQLFTEDVDTTVDFSRLIDLHATCVSCRVLNSGNETWRVLTVPLVVSGSIRFITPEVAIVDGASTIRGAVTLAESVPLLFVLKKEAKEWRICAVRRLAITGAVDRAVVQYD